MKGINQCKNHLLGENIRKIRLEKHIRNTDVATQLQVQRIEISATAYSKMEMRINNPSVDVLIALTKILECDFNAFFENNK